MDDRGLLELAAKAVGLVLIDWNDNWFDYGPGYRYETETGWRELWNPLTDDGDALRLAIKLNIEIRPDAQVFETCTAYMVGAYGYNERELWYEDENGDARTDDPMTATRRAIVRSAAKIGEAMP